MPRGRGELVRIDAEYAVQLVGPDLPIRRDVPVPAAQVCNSLRLGDLRLGGRRPLVEPRPL